VIGGGSSASMSDAGKLILEGDAINFRGGDLLPRGGSGTIGGNVEMKGGEGQGSTEHGESVLISSDLVTYQVVIWT